jgi:hypothetical protein
MFGLTMPMLPGTTLAVERKMTARWCYRCPRDTLKPVRGGKMTLTQGLIAAKIAKYLRSVLIELGLPPSGPTLLYEDSEAAINMVNANRSTERFRHNDIHQSVIQKWQQRCDTKLVHISHPENMGYHMGNVGSTKSGVT